MAYLDAHIDVRRRRRSRRFNVGRVFVINDPAEQEEEEEEEEEEEKEDEEDEEAIHRR